MIPISVLVQTKNESAGIRQCLQALEVFSEVIVVDSNSEDNTVQIAESMGVRVINFTWNGHYPKKKQWQLENVTTQNEWVLFLDADETPTASFIKFLAENLNSATENAPRAYDLQLIYKFDGRELNHGHRVTKRALVRREYAHFPEVDDLKAPGMGELEGHYQPTIDGLVEEIPDALLHDDKDPVRTWFDRHNRYSDWETFLRVNSGTRRTILKLRSRQGRLFSHAPGKPAIFFIYAYFVRGGFLDGSAGLNYALAQSFYYWQISLKVREARRLTNDAREGSS